MTMHSRTTFIPTDPDDRTTRMYDTPEQAIEIAKEAFWLAYQAAGGAMGMGFFQARGNATKDEIWGNVMGMGDYPMPTSAKQGGVWRLRGDYVFGRMLKLNIRLQGATLVVGDDLPRIDYQAWCGEYKTYAALITAAEKALS